MLLLFCGYRNSGAGDCTEPSCLQAESAADVQRAVTAMLLETGTELRIRVPQSAVTDPSAVIRAAAESQVLAGTMLRRAEWKRSGNILTVQAEYSEAPETLRQEKKLLSERAADWCSGNAGEPDAVRVLLAHDMLCRSCTYSDAGPESRAACGALLRHTAVCGGYAEAFALLMEHAGIPVRIVTGIAQLPGGKAEPHAWNLVQLSGSWYHLDCTWDDAGDVPQHAYFLCDDEAMQQTHRWDTKKYPPAKCSGYRYEKIVSEMADCLRKDDAGYTLYNPSRDQAP